MPNHDDDDVTALLGRVAADLGDPSTWPTPKGYPDSLALAAIDAAFSLRSHYTATIAVLDRYRAARRAVGADPDQDGGTELLVAIDAAGGPEQAAITLLNRTRAPGTDRLKVLALHEGVVRLREAGITTATDLRGADRAIAHRAWCGTEGLGPVSFEYLLMNVGVDGVKADTMVRRYVARALGVGSVSVERAHRAVQGVADTLGVSLKAADHRIWRFESGRD